MSDDAHGLPLSDTGSSSVRPGNPLDECVETPLEVTQSDRQQAGAESGPHELHDVPRLDGESGS